ASGPLGNPLGHLRRGKWLLIEGLLWGLWNLASRDRSARRHLRDSARNPEGRATQFLRGNTRASKKLAVSYARDNRRHVRHRRPVWWSSPHSDACWTLVSRSTALGLARASLRGGCFHSLA